MYSLNPCFCKMISEDIDPDHQRITINNGVPPQIFFSFSFSVPTHPPYPPYPSTLPYLQSLTYPSCLYPSLASSSYPTLTTYLFYLSLPHFLLHHSSHTFHASSAFYLIDLVCYGAVAKWMEFFRVPLAWANGASFCAVSRTFLAANGCPLAVGRVTA